MRRGVRRGGEGEDYGDGLASLTSIFSSAVGSTLASSCWSILALLDSETIGSCNWSLGLGRKGFIQARRRGGRTDYANDCKPSVG